MEGDRAGAARAAAAATLAVPGVAGLVGGRGGVWSTAVPGGAVVGVVVAARRDGGLDVAVHVLVALVPLRPLADAVRDAVVDATGAARVDVVVAGLATETHDMEVRA